MTCSLVNSVWHNKVKSNSRKENANLLETFYGYVFEALRYYKDSISFLSVVKQNPTPKEHKSKLPKTKNCGTKLILLKDNVNIYFNMLLLHTEMQLSFSKTIFFLN